MEYLLLVGFLYTLQRLQALLTHAVYIRRRMEVMESRLRTEGQAVWDFQRQPLIAAIESKIEPRDRIHYGK